MARDKIHQIVRTALEKDGWEITDDPFLLLPEDGNIAIDLAAEKLIIATKNLDQIAVEIKTFSAPSLIYEFHRAIGQYFNYETALLEANENRILYMAIPKSVHKDLTNNLLIRKSMERMNMKLIIIDIDKETIEKWIK